MLTYCKIQEAGVQALRGGAPDFPATDPQTNHKLLGWAPYLYSQYPQRIINTTAADPINISQTLEYCSAILTTDPGPSSKHCKMSELLVALGSIIKKLKEPLINKEYLLTTY